MPLVYRISGWTTSRECEQDRVILSTNGQARVGGFGPIVLVGWAQGSGLVSTFKKEMSKTDIYSLGLDWLVTVLCTAGQPELHGHSAGTP